MSKREQQEAVVAVERAMVAIRRSQTRRALGRLAQADGGRAVDPTLFGVLDAVEGRDGSCSVGDVAAALGVDQPRASRLVLRAVEEGWVARRPDPSDARRALLALTADGQEQVDRTHRFRRQVFARAMADWPDADRVAFARLLTAFVDGFGRETDSDGPRTG
ncbi:MarR family winged helix-turn-helix transcriptional regulator [Streptomyces roseicoloratus]|uniref:MarR family winged helix-turn-helix transcriptional regulator n=1 Tax=Streptomyces roseicoloratus TaxID=2508722 RepID=A0ABY9RSS5_9ACTN|nr:MarR family winged helix-turn-helix transcriptional regulator [Streptomyces roseicoloratus]WMX44990.1 MarR family winged helix-turn-helix transcriptional regulator [Streptomyces roseicoloratus]